jgi:hypothetical protein
VLGAFQAWIGPRLDRTDQRWAAACGRPSDADHAIDSASSDPTISFQQMASAGVGSRLVPIALPDEFLALRRPAHPARSLGLSTDVVAKVKAELGGSATEGGPWPVDPAPPTV